MLLDCLSPWECLAASWVLPAWNTKRGILEVPVILQWTLCKQSSPRRGHPRIPEPAHPHPTQQQHQNPYLQTTLLASYLKSSVHRQENQLSCSPRLHTSHSIPRGSPAHQDTPHPASAQPQLWHTSSFALAFTDNAHPMHMHTECLSGYSGVSTKPAPAESCIPARQSTLDHRMQSTQLQPVLFLCLLASLQLTPVWHSTSSELCEICMSKKLLQLFLNFYGGKTGAKGRKALQPIWFGAEVCWKPV